MIDAHIDARIRKAVRDFVRPRDLESWEDDFVQELRVRVLEHGESVARTWKMRHQISNISQAWFGRSRRHNRLQLERCEEQETLEELLTVAPVEPAAVISWHRLREQWGRMSAHERAAVFMVVTGATLEETAKDAGTCRQNIARGKETTLLRINSPATFAAVRAARSREAADRAKAYYHRTKASRQEAAE